MRKRGKGVCGAENGGLGGQAEEEAAKAREARIEAENKARSGEDMYLHVCVCVFVHLYVCMHVYLYICMYIHSARDRRLVLCAGFGVECAGFARSSAE